jgi:hypothetical protein
MKSGKETKAKSRAREINQPPRGAKLAPSRDEVRHKG